MIKGVQICISSIYFNCKTWFFGWGWIQSKYM